MKLSILTLTLSACLLIGCSKPAKPAKSIDNADAADNIESHNPHSIEALTDTLQADGVDINSPEVQPIITADGKIQINWELIDTNTPKADTNSYQYPIAIDSQAVQNYAKAYNISDQQAQHSIVVSMAAPEALVKILDQLEDGYKDHELTDGADMKLIIHTKDNVVADEHEYVFADKFGEGLVLPIEIRPAK